jgi:hypothetical protein
MIGLKEFTMASKAVRYTPEFKRQMVDLVRSGRTPASLAKELRPDVLVDLALGQAGRTRCG